MSDQGDRMEAGRAAATAEIVKKIDFLLIHPLGVWPDDLSEIMDSVKREGVPFEAIQEQVIAAVTQIMLANEGDEDYLLHRLKAVAECVPAEIWKTPELEKAAKKRISEAIRTGVKALELIKEVLEYFPQLQEYVSSEEIQELALTHIYNNCIVSPNAKNGTDFSDYNPTYLREYMVFFGLTEAAVAEAMRFTPDIIEDLEGLLQQEQIHASIYGIGRFMQIINEYRALTDLGGADAKSNEILKDAIEAWLDYSQKQKDTGYSLYLIQMLAQLEPIRTDPQLVEALKANLQNSIARYKERLSEFPDDGMNQRSLNESKKTLEELAGLK